ERRRAGENKDACGGIVAQLGHDATEIRQHGVAQRVTTLGAVEGHGGERAVAVEADVVGHGRRDIIGAPMSEPIVWRPTPEYVERARITRLMRRLGGGTLAELHRRSVEDPEGHWRGVIAALDIRFTQPCTRVLEGTRCPPGPG